MLRRASANWKCGQIFLFGPGIVLCGELDAWVLVGLAVVGCCLSSLSFGLENWTCTGTALDGAPRLCSQVHDVD